MLDLQEGQLGVSQSWLWVLQNPRFQNLRFQNPRIHEGSLSHSGNRSRPSQRDLDPSQGQEGWTGFENQEGCTELDPRRMGKRLDPRMDRQHLEPRSTDRLWIRVWIPGQTPGVTGDRLTQSHSPWLPVPDRNKKWQPCLSRASWQQSRPVPLLFLFHSPAFPALQTPPFPALCPAGLGEVSPVPPGPKMPRCVGTPAQGSSLCSRHSWAFPLFPFPEESGCAPGSAPSAQPKAGSASG